MWRLLLRFQKNKNVREGAHLHEQFFFFFFIFFLIHTNQPTTMSFQLEPEGECLLARYAAALNVPALIGNAFGFVRTDVTRALEAFHAALAARSVDIDRFPVATIEMLVLRITMTRSFWSRMVSAVADGKFAAVDDDDDDDEDDDDDDDDGDSSSSDDDSGGGDGRRASSSASASSLPPFMQWISTNWHRVLLVLVILAQKYVVDNDRRFNTKSMLVWWAGATNLPVCSMRQFILMERVIFCHCMGCCIMGCGGDDDERQQQQQQQCHQFWDTFVQAVMQVAPCSRYGDRQYECRAPPKLLHSAQYGPTPLDAACVNGWLRSQCRRPRRRPYRHYRCRRSPRRHHHRQQKTAAAAALEDAAAALVVSRRPGSS